MIVQYIVKGPITAILLCCFLLVNLTLSKSISSNEKSQLPTSTDINDLGRTTEVYPSTATSVDVTTSPNLSTETSYQNALETTSIAVENLPTSSDVYFSDDGTSPDAPSVSTTPETSLLQDVNTIQHHPAAQIDTPIPQLDTILTEPVLVQDAQIIPEMQSHPLDVVSSTNTPQDHLPVMDDQIYQLSQEVQHHPTDAVSSTNVPQDSLPVMDDQIYQLSQEVQQHPTEVVSSVNAPQDSLPAMNDQYFQLSQEVQHHPAAVLSSTNIPQDPLPAMDDQFYPLSQEVQHHPVELVSSANVPQDPLPAMDDQFYQLSQEVAHHPTEGESSANKPQEGVIDLLNSGSFKSEPLVQHFPVNALAAAVDDSVPKSQPNFTDALTIPDDTYKPKLPTSLMYDDEVYDDYGDAMRNGRDAFDVYDDLPSNDYTTLEPAEPEEGIYGLDDLTESDLEQLDDNDLEELENALASSEQSDDKYDDFGESNAAGGANSIGYSGEVFDDLGEMNGLSGSPHPFKIPKHQNYLSTLVNLKHFTNKFNGYTQQPSFENDEAEDDTAHKMRIFESQAAGKSRKNLYNDRLVALLDIYNKNANRKNIQANRPKGKSLKYDTKALLQTYDALMEIKHRKMGQTGKYVKSYKGKGDRSKQIRRLQRIKRLMALAAKRKAAKTKTASKSGLQIASSTITKITEPSSNDMPMMSLSSLQNGIKSRYRHPNEATNPINDVVDKLNRAIYYNQDDLTSLQEAHFHPGDVAAAPLESGNIQPNPFFNNQNKDQRPPVPRYPEYDEVEGVEYEAPETEEEAEADEGEDDFLNNLFGIPARKRGNGQSYQNNAELYGSCPAVPVQVSGSKVTVTTSEGCQVVISITGSTGGDGKNLGIQVSYNNKVIV